MVGQDTPDAGPGRPEGGQVATTGEGSRFMPLSAIDWLLDTGWRWGWLSVFIVLAPGLATWPVLSGVGVAHVLANDLAPSLRTEFLVHLLVTGLSGVGVYLAFWRWLAQRRPGGATFEQACRQLNRIGLLTLAAPLIAGIATPGIERDHPFLTLLLIGMVAAVVGVVAYRLLAAASAWVADHRAPSPWTWSAVAVITGAYAAGLSHLALVDHRNLGTHVYDLGIYNNILWRTLHGDFLGCDICIGDTHLTAHFDPILALLVPVYALFPRPETLLVWQSVWLSMGVIPLFLLASRRLGDARLAVPIGLMYTLFPALHGVNLFDFHSLTLVVPTLLWVICLLDLGRLGWYAVALAVMLATREDMALLACFVGVYAILQRRTAVGLATIGVSLSWLVFVKGYMMADAGLIMSGGDSHSYAHFFAEMIPHPDEGVRGLVVSAVTNPVFAVKVLLTEKKVFFFLAMLGPLLFLPLLAGRKTVMMLYGLVFLGLATRKYMYSLHFQYSSVFFPILFAALPDGLERVRQLRVVRWAGLSPDRVRWALVIAALCSTLMASWKFGALAPNASFRAGWNRLDRTPSEYRVERYAWVQEVIQQIPQDASVCVTNDVGSQVSSRFHLSLWPSLEDADAMFVKTSELGGSGERRVERLVDNGVYRVVADDYGIQLLLRVPEDERASARSEVRARKAEARERAASKRREKGER